MLTIIIEECYDNMKIRNGRRMNEGIDRRVNPNRKLPRRKEKREGIIGASILGGAAAGLTAGAVGNLVDKMDEDTGKRRARRTGRRGNLRFVDNRKRAILGRGEDPGFDEYDINEGRRCREGRCGTRKGFPTKRVREEEALNRTERPNMARRRPVGRRER